MLLYYKIILILSLPNLMIIYSNNPECLPAATARCDCNGRSRNCLRDALGLHCVDCQGNTEGRRCERCKAGFYLEGAGLSCTPCRCNPTGEKPNACSSHPEFGVRDHALFSFQVLSAPHVTAGGAAAVGTESRGKSVTAAPRAR